VGARFEFRKGVIDLRQADAARNHRVELQLAGEIEVDEARHVHREPVGAHVRSLNAPLAEKVGAVELDIHADRDEADDGGCTAAAQHPERLLRSLLEADGFKGMLHAALRQRADLFDGIAALGVDDVRRAKLLGELEFGVNDVDRNDAPCPGDGGAVYRRQTGPRRSR